MSAFLVGLTGGMASGKSTVADWLHDAGYRVIDADEIVADLYAPGGAGTEAIVRLFGEGFLDGDGSVDHRAVAKRVFDDDEALESLEQAIHPLVRERFAQIAAQTDGVAVLEATLLVEAGYTTDFDLIVTVEADGDLRLERAVARGLERTEAEARMRAQGDGADRRAAADWEISNNAGLEELRAEVDVLLSEIDQLRKGR